jgi:carbamoyltransferase
MNYIGISAGFHDAAVSVVNSHGDITFAGHSERYSKIKHDKNLSTGLIEDALNYVDDDFEIHYYEKPVLKYLRQLRAGQPSKVSSIFPSNVISKPIHNMLGNKKIHTHGHHLSHAAAGFQTSKFDNATVVVIDAIGEFDTISIYEARYNKNGVAIYKKLWGQTYPHSIGLFYSAMTKHVGLKPMDEEYILMGMAGWGKPNSSSLLNMSLLEDDREITFKDNLHIGINKPWLANLLDYDIAASTQVLAEKLIYNVIKRARSLSSGKNLVYMGGVALNCLANRKLGEYFDNIWIMPNPGDAGSSLGAASLGYSGNINWRDSFLGHCIPGSYPVNTTLDHLFRGDVVGVASGRAEFGPRALGNRSLFADPRGKDIKDKVNEIKRRQKFRPFAPVILAEYADNYFKMHTGWESSPYMQSVATCKHPHDFPAIVHVDGTSRVQTVEKDGSGIRELLEKWYVLTGCPMLLNTSLNIRGEPMVNDRADADRFEKLYNIEVMS